MSSPPPTPPSGTSPPRSEAGSVPQQEAGPIVAIPVQHPVAVPAPVTVEPAPRKFPAPCWTQEETLALISSYQDKWYSLRRRNLRTADWEAVAEEVTRRCPNQIPQKTSAQCRHKMEKLRKRYRTEKQRINSLPQNGNSRFFGSSWVFFDLMDSMELGSGGSNNHPNNLTNINANHNINHNMNHNHSNTNNNPQISNIGKVDLEVKPFSMNMNVKGSNVVVDGNEISNSKKGDLGQYFDEIMLGMGGSNKGKSQNHGFDVRSAPPHIKLKVKNHHHSRHDYGAGGGDLTNDFDDADEYNGGGGGGGGRGLMPPPSGYKRKSANYDRYEEVYSSGKMMQLNGGSSSSRKESGGGGSRGRESVVGEMVASIKMLGEGLVKMEKMKMEMMRDIEKMRMEMEMKRSEMILESQHLIVNAFVEGLKKNKKVKVMEIE